MKFYYTVKTLKWFLLFRSDTYDDLEDVSMTSSHLFNLDALSALDPKYYEADPKTSKAALRNRLRSLQQSGHASVHP